MRVPFLVFFTLVYSVPIVSAGDLPPVGQRVYILNSTRPSTPLTIRNLSDFDKKLGNGLMKDPDFSGPSDNQKVTRSGAVPQIIAPKKFSRISFKKVSVAGRYLVPRVVFDKSPIQYNQREEAPAVNYLEKIKASESELRDFDW